MQVDDSTAPVTPVNNSPPEITAAASHRPRHGGVVEIESMPPAQPATPVVREPIFDKQRQMAVNNLLLEEKISSAREKPVVQAPRTAVGETNVVSMEKNQASPIFQPNIEKKFQERHVGWHKTQRSSAPKTQSWRERIRPLWYSPKLRLALVVVLIIGMTSGGIWAWGSWQWRQTRSHWQEITANVQRGDIAAITSQLQYWQNQEKFWRQTTTSFHPLLRIILGKDKSIFIDKSLDIVRSSLQVANDGAQIYQKMEDGYQQFVGAQDGDSIQSWRAATGRLEGIYGGLTSIYSELQKLNNPFGWAAVNDLSNQMQKELPTVRRNLLAVQQVGYVLPDLLGEGGLKRYLVLLQNNQELRPTGGFIGSFAVVTIEKGKLIDFVIHDVYEADGQLRGYVTPPAEIPQYLGEAQWYLRDVNWSADFPTVAAQAQWFVEKELGLHTDGVIATNLNFVQLLLAAVGPLEIPDYNEVVTKDNLYERAQQRSELNFFPGSKQKRDFLSAVAQQLYLQLAQGKVSKIALASSVLQSLERSDLLVGLNSASGAAVFKDLGWDGAVRNPACPSVFAGLSCVVDTAMQIEANVGVNKVNRYVERKITDKVQLQNGQAQHVRTITLINNSPQKAWPGGPYRVYLRLYVPPSAQLTNITMAGNILDSNSVRISTEAGRLVWGWYVEVPAQSQKSITINYSLPNAYSINGGTSVYALFEQKQPGTSGDQVTQEIVTKDKKIITIAPQPASSGQNMAVFNSNRLTHQFVAVEVQ